MLKKILCFVLLLLFVAGSSLAEAPSPSIDKLYKIESDYMKISKFPCNLVLFDIVMVDIDLSMLTQDDYVTATLYLPLVPENLDDIILFDGYHVAHFSFERINEGCVRIASKVKDIAMFDGSVGLYLFVTGYEK